MRYLLFLFLSLPVLGKGQNINIKLFSTNNLQEVQFTPIEGKYEFVSNNKIYHRVQQGDTFAIQTKGKKIRILKPNGKNGGSFKHLQIRGVGQNNSFILKPANLELKERSYDDDLYVEELNSYLNIINDVNFEKYIAGVVESEGGSKAHIEYYKTQAILCRTYAMKQYQKHLENGYNLCDGVHCQAYHHKCIYNKDIVKAANETAGLVIVDKDLKVITATFHSNSGGITANSEDVWVSALPYLRSVEDKYSIGQHNYIWEKKIKKSDWEEYLQKNNIVSNKNISYSFYPKGRPVDYSYNGKTIPLKKIRSDWQLKSTFFTVEDSKDFVTLKGKGYGHGVGLAQEGAMNMAKQGFDYHTIINHYYKDVSIMSIRALSFFHVE